MKLPPTRQRPGEAFGPAIEHGAPAGHPGAIDIGRRIVDEQDRLRHRDAHARLGVGEEHPVGLAHAERRRIDDVVEMRAEPGMLLQPGDPN